MSLFVLLKEILTDTTVAKIAQINGEKPEKIQKIVDGLGAALTGGLLKRVSNEYGMNLVHGQVQKNALDSNQLQNVLQNSDDWAAFLANGDKLFNTLMPGIKSPVTSLVAKYAGTRNSLVSSLCGLVAPAILAALQKQVANQQLDANGLANYLGNQREDLLKVAPELNSGLIESLGIQSLLENFAVPEIEVPVTKATEPRPSQSFLDTNQSPDAEPTDFRPYLKWLGIAAVVAGIVVGGVYFWNNRSTTATEEVEADTLDIAEARTVTEPAPKDTAAKATPSASTATDSLNPMQAYLTDATAKIGKVFKFKGVDFENNTLQLKPAAAQPVRDLANLLKNSPTTEIKLIAYANDAQAPMTNKMLSVKRAYALKQQLIDAGIGVMRVDAEGLGNGVSLRDTSRRANRVPMRDIFVKFVKK
jgi:outer membrane protein OmpA-like peptidoglycan-associated protein